MDFNGLTITGGVTISPQSRYAIYSFGRISVGSTAGGMGQYTSITPTGTVASETTNPAASVRYWAAACSYGGDRGLIFSGYSLSTAVYSTNLVSNTGQVFGDTAQVSGVSFRGSASGAGYGIDKGLIVSGNAHTNPLYISQSTQQVVNKISNTGVVAIDSSFAGMTRRSEGMSATYGLDKVITTGGLSYTGTTAPGVPMTYYEWFDNSGNFAQYGFVLAGSTRYNGAAAEYGYDKAINGYGYVGTANFLSWVNKINNVGYVDVDSVFVGGTPRQGLGGAGYGIDTCMFLGGFGVGNTATTNVTIINNLGNMVSDATMAGFTARGDMASTHL